MSLDVIEFSGEKFKSDDVKKYICPAATDKELMEFMMICKARSLNPFLKEVYWTKFGNTVAIMVGKEAILKKARQNQDYNGFVYGYFKKDGTKTEFPSSDVIGAWCEVYIKGIDHPFRSSVMLSEYNNMGNQMWKTKPLSMVRKVAICQAHREAYPESFNGLYDEYEVGELQRSGESVIVDSQESGYRLSDKYHKLIKELEGCKSYDDLSNTWSMMRYILNTMTNEEIKAINLKKEQMKNAFLSRTVNDHPIDDVKNTAVIIEVVNDSKTPESKEQEVVNA